MLWRRCARAARSWWWGLILGTAVAACASLLISAAQAPIYRATSILTVGSLSDAADPGATSGGDGQLALTYAELIVQPSFIEPALHSVAPGRDVASLAGRVSASVLPGTRLVAVSVDDESPEMSRTLANALAETVVAKARSEAPKASAASQDAIKAQLSRLESQLAESGAALEAARASSNGDPAAVTRLQTDLLQRQVAYAQLLEAERLMAQNQTAPAQLEVSADTPTTPIRPETVRNVLLSACVGLAVALLLVLLVEVLDDTVKSAADVREAAGLPTLGIIAGGPKGRSGLRSLVDLSRPSDFSDSYQLLRASFCNALGEGTGRVVMVTSPGRGGQSRTVASLGLVLAASHRKVILVDADLHRPSLHRAFGLEADQGLTGLLVDPSQRLDENVLATTQIGLWILPGGASTPNGADLLSSVRFRQTVVELKRLADIVLIDAPPTTKVADTLVLAGVVDSTVIVADAGSTRGGDLAKSVEILACTPARCLGIILNNADGRAVRAGLERAAFSGTLFAPAADVSARRATT